MPISSAVDNTMACFFDVYDGPYVVNRIFGNTTYELMYIHTQKIKGTFHIDNLKPYM